MASLAGERSGLHRCIVSAAAAKPSPLSFYERFSSRLRGGSYPAAPHSARGVP
jgi:hypothetical protein